MRVGAEAFAFEAQQKFASAQSGEEPRSAARRGAGEPRRRARSGGEALGGAKRLLERENLGCARVLVCLRPGRLSVVTALFESLAADAPGYPVNFPCQLQAISAVGCHPQGARWRKALRGDFKRPEPLPAVV